LFCQIPRLSSGCKATKSLAVLIISSMSLLKSREFQI
jgi:hypothetical protein